RDAAARLAAERPGAVMRRKRGAEEDAGIALLEADHPGAAGKAHRVRAVARIAVDGRAAISVPPDIGIFDARVQVERGGRSQREIAPERDVAGEIMRE